MKQKILSILWCSSIFIIPWQVHADSTGPLGYGSAEHQYSLESDRPDFTEGSSTVTAGHLQIEGGYSYVYNDNSEGRSESHTLPLLLLRAGIKDDLELRIAWEGYTNQSLRSDGQSEFVSQGGTDFSVGIKHRMYTEEGALPDISFIAELGIPAGAKATTADEVEPALKLIWAHSLPGDFSLAGNINFSGPVEDSQRFFETAASIALAVPLNATIGTYVEYFGFYPGRDAPERSSMNFLNGGFTYGVTENLQLDVLAGFGLNDQADDFFTGLGFALRI
jgi:hypothetical protein